jgi:hypothetical protein
MTRYLAVVSAVLLACAVASAQSAAPAMASTTSAASTKSPYIMEFQKIESQWSAAENKHNQYGLDLVLSPLLVNVSQNGDITTHDQQIVKALNNDDRMYYLSQRVIAVRMLGDIAVVNGTYTLRHRVNSAVVLDHGVFTHVFEREHGRWMCVNAQRTLVSQVSNAKKKHHVKHTDEKASTRSHPFHIPFIH